MAGATSKDLLEKDIFKLLDIEDVSDEKKQELFQTMMNTVDARAMTRMASELSEKEVEEFTKVAEENDPQKLKNWLETKKIDLPKIVTEEAIRYRVEITELINLSTKGK